jgi:hypothetical protein
MDIKSRLEGIDLIQLNYELDAGLRWQGLSPEQFSDCKTAFLHLMTSPLTSPFGLFAASISELGEEIDWGDASHQDSVLRFSTALDSLEYAGLTRLNQMPDGNHIWFLPLVVKHLLPPTISKLQTWLISWEKIPDTPLKSEWLEQLKSVAREWGPFASRVMLEIAKMQAEKKSDEF